MKKLISLLLVFIMLIAVVSCDTAGNNSIDSENTNGSVLTDTDVNYPVDSDEVETTEAINTTEIPAEKNDVVFKAGYARTVITPELPAPVNGTMDDQIMTKVKDDMYATCIAINDGENTALIYTVDVKNIGPKVYGAIQLRVSVTTKVPKENIILSATHSHSAFTPLDNPSKSTSDSLKKWTLQLPAVMADIAKEAIADMEEAEIYFGTESTPGMAFIRRYVHVDGSYSGCQTGSHLKSSAAVIGTVMDVDDTLQILRLVRKEKKDIIMTNWQAHLATARAVYPPEVTADLAYYVRTKVEKKSNDALVAYFAGASGNVNLSAPSEALRKYKSYEDVGVYLARVVLEGMELENLTKLESGEIKGLSVTYAAEARKCTDAEKIAQANEVMALENGSAEQIALMVKYGFESLYAPKGIIASSNRTDSTYDLHLSALALGDLAFIGAPYEMFDNSGMQIKEGSPYNATFILTGAGGYWAYIPSIEYFNEYGGYEVDNTSFAKGVAEKLVAEYLRMLKKLKGIS